MVTKSEIRAAWQDYLEKYKIAFEAIMSRDKAKTAWDKVLDLNAKEAHMPGGWNAAIDIQQVVNQRGDFEAALAREKMETAARAYYISRVEEASHRDMERMLAAITWEGLSKELDAERLEAYEKMVERTVLPEG